MQKSPSFELEAWIGKLLTLNAWAMPWRKQLLDPNWQGEWDRVTEDGDEEGGLTGRHLVEDSDSFVEARKAENAQRYKQGPEVWNEWAEAMRSARHEAEEAKRWDTGSSESSPGNQPTAVFHALAESDFKETSFNDDAYFKEFIFPGNANFTSVSFQDVDFSQAQFDGTATFNNATFGVVETKSEARFLFTKFIGGRAYFEDATFRGSANFYFAGFLAGARFDRAQFRSSAIFQSAVFNGDGVFNSGTDTRTRNSGAVFGGYTSFIGARFLVPHPHDPFAGRGEARFDGVTFTGEALFRAATFCADATFARATFEGDASFEGALPCDLISVGAARATEFRSGADFSEVIFDGSASFATANFHGDASFHSVVGRGDLLLSDAVFAHVPDFLGASLAGLLRLDNVVTPRYPWFGWCPSKDAPARFRELKRRAGEAHDHDRQLEFFAQEIRTSRFHAKGRTGFVPRVWELRFWFGLLYGTFSNFGRSLWRPPLFWAVLLLGFGAFYLGEHDEMRKARADSGSGVLMAYAQTTLSALRNPPTCRQHKDQLFANTNAVAEALNLSLANGLLFEGGRSNGSRRTNGCLFGVEAIGEQEYPRVSSAVFRASVAQGLASAVLIFLFLLAVRNLLRLS
jgi:uncharacterized protein YjbI with pentapeptide repeats